MDDSHPREIEALLTWVLSDGRLRTDDELVEVMVQELSFTKRGI
jgi:hypothetical protein